MIPLPPKRPQPKPQIGALSAGDWVGILAVAIIFVVVMVLWGVSFAPAR